jgi:hypothetical protein
MKTGIDEAIALGKRLVPHGFAPPVRIPWRAFAWGGAVHAFVRGLFIPVARVPKPLVWLPGPPTEPMVDLAATAIDEFTATGLDASAVDAFDDFADAA